MMTTYNMNLQFNEQIPLWLYVFPKFRYANTTQVVVAFFLLFYLHTDWRRWPPSTEICKVYVVSLYMHKWLYILCITCLQFCFGSLFDHRHQRRNENRKLRMDLILLENLGHPTVRTKSNSDDSNDDDDGCRARSQLAYYC